MLRIDCLPLWPSDHKPLSGGLPPRYFLAACSNASRSSDLVLAMALCA